MFDVMKNSLEVLNRQNERPKVLIVEDQPVNVHALSRLLEADYELLVAVNGCKGLALAQSESPDLILLDIGLPDMDGYEVCRRLQHDDSTMRIPVVFVTAKDTDADEEEGLSIGASDYISKPFHPEITRVRIANLLKRKLAEDALNRTVAELREALARIKTLRGLIPICSACKKIRKDDGYWTQVEVFVRDHTEAEFSHGICPACMEKLYPSTTSDRSCVNRRADSGEERR